MPRLNFYLFCIVLSFCQSSSIRAAEDAVIEQYQQTIDELEAEYGAYDTSLAEPLSGLAEALQSSGKHQQAIAALKRSLHVRRVNDGMNSLSQEPALRLLNDSYQAVGNNGAVAANYQRRLDLLQNNNSGGAAEKLALQLEAAHWHRSQYIQLRNKQAAAHLMESIRLLADASNTSVLYNGPLKAQLLNSEIQNHYYLIQHYQRFAPRPPDDYVRRRSVRFRPRYRDETSFEYQLAYDSYIRRETARLSKRYAREQIDEAESKALAAYSQLARFHKANDNPLQQANSLVQRGDWLTLFGDQPYQAFTYYRQGWELLTRNQQLDERARLFGKPQLLPVFDQPDPANFDQIAKVRLDVDSSGKARNIHVLETQPTDKSIASKAHRQLRDARFRSRLDNGKPVASENIELSLLVY